MSHNVIAASVGAAAAAAGIWYLFKLAYSEESPGIRKTRKKATSVSRSFSAELMGGGGGGEVPQNFVYRHDAVADQTTGVLKEATVLVMVGLPGRGKSAIAARTAQYLRFFHGVDAAVFSTGEKRRKSIGYADNTWFEYASHEPDKARSMRQFFLETLDDVKMYLIGGGCRVAILDGSNITVERRLEVYTDLKKLGKVQVIFVEISNDETMINEQDMSKLDVVTVGRAKVPCAKADFLARVQHYTKVYEPLAADPAQAPHGAHEMEFSYIKCIDYGSTVIQNKIKGYMPGRIAQFIGNTSRCHWNRGPVKKLYLSRHGQSEYNAAGRIGGDTGLTPHGEEYALALAEYAREEVCLDAEGRRVPARLWTSTLKRTRETARHINCGIIIQDGYPFIQMKPREWSNLDEIYAGACDGMTYEEIKQQFANEAFCRAADKLSYRYPRGESYLDVIQRLEPLVQEIERHKESLLIVGHQGVLRMILAYYSGIPRSLAPNLELKLNRVTTIEPHAHGCEVSSVNLLEKVTLADDGQKNL